MIGIGAIKTRFETLAPYLDERARRLAELRAMMDNAPPRWRPFIVAAIFTGMRASELRGLRWEDVDLEAGVIHVRQRADAWGTLGAPKSKAGRREIPLAPAVINALREWRLACPKGELDLVFPNERGKVLNLPNVWRRVFAPLQVRCGIVAEGRPKYGLHALRHAAASLFIEQGWQPKKVQTVLGHRPRAVNLGADRGYDAADFVEKLRTLNVRPHVSRNTSGRRSAIDRRTTRHPGYATSQRKRKRIEEAFDWIKTVAGMKRARLRGLDKVDWTSAFAAAAYNLVRLPKLLMASP
jgi:IS5 family transposase